MITGGIFDKLYIRAAKNKTLEEVELISEALFLLEMGMNRITPFDGFLNFEILDKIIDYRAHRYQRQTGCKEPSTKTWIAIQKAFREINEEYDRQNSR